MKRVITLLATVVVAIAMSGWALAQGPRGGVGRHGGSPGGGVGRPATTGLEHAEATANPHGQRGIENAEAKQAAHKDQDKDVDNDNDHGKGKDKDKDKDKDNDKGKAKGKHKHHKHSD